MSWEGATFMHYENSQNFVPMIDSHLTSDVGGSTEDAEQFSGVLILLHSPQAPHGLPEA